MSHGHDPSCKRKLRIWPSQDMPAAQSCRARLSVWLRETTCYHPRSFPDVGRALCKHTSDPQMDTAKIVLCECSDGLRKAMYNSIFVLPTILVPILHFNLPIKDTSVKDRTPCPLLGVCKVGLCGKCLDANVCF